MHLLQNRINLCMKISCGLKYKTLICHNVETVLLLKIYKLQPLDFATSYRTSVVFLECNMSPYCFANGILCQSAYTRSTRFPAKLQKVESHKDKSKQVLNTLPLFCSKFQVNIYGFAQRLRQPLCQQEHAGHLNHTFFLGQ